MIANAQLGPQTQATMFNKPKCYCPTGSDLISNKLKKNAVIGKYMLGANSKITIYDLHIAK